MNFYKHISTESASKLFNGVLAFAFIAASGSSAASKLAFAG
jgi:hypothetical protein